MQIVRLELYNTAEAITLGSLLREQIPDSLPLARRLAAQALRCHQLPEGHFITRIYVGGLKHKLPFLRWPQSQIFYALTNLLRTLHVPSPTTAEVERGRVVDIEQRIIARS